MGTAGFYFINRISKYSDPYITLKVGPLEGRVASFVEIHGLNASRWGSGGLGFKGLGFRV